MSVERELRRVAGPRAAEDDLWAVVERELAPPPDRPLHALPLRIVVPSRSLAQHLAGTFTRRAGRPLLGLRIDTLRGFAHELLAGAGEALVEGDLALATLAERAARDADALHGELADYRDGFAPVGAAVRDLIDAGFRSAEHGPALSEALAETQAGGARSPASRRAHAVLEATAGVERELERQGIAPVARLFQRAAEWLARDVGERSGARALFVYGFANATGAVLDLLTTLLRHPRSRIWIDRPPDPAAPAADGATGATRTTGTTGTTVSAGTAAPSDEADHGAAAAAPPPAGEEHLRRLVEAAQGVPAVRTLDADPVAVDAARPPRLWRAAGARAEVRAVAGAIDRLLEDGVRPESILVVARDLAPYGAALERTFGALGIPFSAPSASGAFTPFGRRAVALLELLRARGRTRVERWLDVVGKPGFLQQGERRQSRADLATALAELGITRLSQLAELDVDALGGERTRLSTPRAFRRLQDDAGPVVLGRRSLDHWALAAARERARELLEHPALAGHETRLGDFVRDLRDLVRRGLEWRNPLGDGARWTQAAAALAPLSGLSLSPADRCNLLEAALEPHLRDTLGGEGGGVGVLSVMEARSRTAEHLFVLGMNRGVFPRRPREDPLLPDELRRGLRAVLPDLPLKLEAHEEERYLFAQLLAASPDVTLSWQAETDDGKALAPSSLVELLLWQGQTAADVGPIASPGGDPGARHARLTPLETLQRAGTSGALRRFEELLPLVLDATRAPERVAACPSERLAAARCAVLRELDARRAPAGLGPYMGLVGPVEAPLDPRRNPPYVTRLERLATCGWQQFLQGVLRVERAADPLERLPAIEARAIGILVHDTVETWVRQNLPEVAAAEDEGDDAQAARDFVQAGAWADLAVVEAATTDADELERIARSHAAARLRAEGIPYVGMVEALVHCARPFLQRLVELEGWSKTPPRLCGAELSGEVVCTVGGAQVPLAFRADLVDRPPERPGDVRLTDLKTGKPIGTAKSPKGRAKKVAESVQRGEKLQAMAYALASGGTGRYAFLGPDVDRDNALVEVDGGQSELVAAFDATVAVLIEAMHAGAYVPRVVDEKLDKAPKACRFCEVASACHAGDSGYRGRFVDWARSLGQEQAPSSTPVEERWFALR